MRPAPYCQSRTQVLPSHCSAIPLGAINCMIEIWSASDAGSSQSGKWRRRGGDGPRVLDLDMALITSSTGLCQEFGHRTSPKPKGGGEMQSSGVAIENSKSFTREEGDLGHAVGTCTHLLSLGVIWCRNHISFISGPQ